LHDARRRGFGRGTRRRCSWPGRSSSRRTRRGTASSTTRPRSWSSAASSTWGCPWSCCRCSSISCRSRARRARGGSRPRSAGV